MYKSYNVINSKQGENDDYNEVDDDSNYFMIEMMDDGLIYMCGLTE